MKVRLTTKSPLHVGGREGVLSPLEFIYFEHLCYVVSEEKLARALHAAGKMDVFVNWFSRFSEQDKNRRSLRNFLREHSLLNCEFLKQIRIYTIPPPACVPEMDNLHSFIRDGFSRPYLPGSAVKGAIRTAFLNKALKDLDPALLQTFLIVPVTECLIEYSNDPRSRGRDSEFRNTFKQNFYRRLDFDFFRHFVLPDEDKYDPHSDIFRCLRVTDSAHFANTTRVEAIKVYNARSDPKPWTTFAECLPKDSVAEWEISLDEALLEEFKKQNEKTSFGTDFATMENMLRDPLTVWAEMGQDLWVEEDKFLFREFRLSNVMPTSNGTPLVRLGWGGGLMGTALGMRLPDDLRERLRNALFEQRPGTPAPKTRRLVVQDDETPTPLGWATVERVS